jgi:hypothetical protein
VPFRLVALFFLTGCYLSRARDPGDARLDATPALDAMVLDAPAPFDGTPPRDAPPPIDAPSSVDAPSCAPEDRVTTVCAVSGTGTLPSSRPFSLPLRWSSCRCEATRSCTVRVEGGVIDVRTENCRSDVVCDECTTETACDVPALAPGAYRLLIDGIDTASMNVEPEPPRVSRPTCWEVPPRRDESLVCAPERVSELRPGRLCWRSVEDVGSNARLTLTAGCRSCFDQSGGCRVVRDGTTLRVEPTLFSCDCPVCDGCAEPCSALEIACRTPALRDGTYDVVVQEGPRSTPVGRLEVRDVAGPGPETCAEL